MHDVHVGRLRGQSRALDSRNLKGQMVATVMWVLGTKAWFSASAAGALHH